MEWMCPFFILLSIVGEVCLMECHELHVLFWKSNGVFWAQNILVECDVSHLLFSGVMQYCLRRVPTWSVMCTVMF